MKTEENLMLMETGQLLLHKRVLVIDHDPSVRLLMREILASEDIVVEEAGDGLSALAVFERFRPHLVLLDVNTTIMDGLSVCKEINNHPQGRNVAVVMVTGLNDHELIERAYQVGAADFITRPIAWPIFTHRVSYLLRANSAIVALRYQRQHLEKMINDKTTDIKAAKELADRANQGKTEFLANMSHELRTPMHAILGFAEIGENKLNSVDKVSSEKLLRYFSRIRQSGQRLLTLLNDLLDLSKLEAGHMKFEMQEHNMRQIVETSIAEFRALLDERSLAVNVESTTFDIIAWLDAGRMLQVVSNLLSNAIKFTQEGGIINITFAEDGLSEGQSEGGAGGPPSISVTVIDQGMGIPQDELETIFDKFVQSSKTSSGRGGTGLGLAICREIIEGHGGTIQASNNEDGGAAFTLSIPRHPVTHSKFQQLSYLLRNASSDSIKTGDFSYSKPAEIA